MLDGATLTPLVGVPPPTRTMIHHAEGDATPNPTLSEENLVGQETGHDLFRGDLRRDSPNSLAPLLDPLNNPGNFFGLNFPRRNNLGNVVSDFLFKIEGVKRLVWEENCPTHLVLDGDIHQGDLIGLSHRCQHPSQVDLIYGAARGH